MMIAVVLLLCFLVNTVLTQAKCVSPTAVPTVSPTENPSTIAPSISRKPTARPTTRSPTFVPSFIPTAIPTTASPSTQPTYSPSFRPGDPTPEPSLPPTLQPTVTPSYQPSRLPTVQPTRRPSCIPTAIPTVAPTFSLAPTFAPTAVPSARPTPVPSYVPTKIPTFSPTLAVTAPTFDPTADPTAMPTFTVTASPSATPTPLPTFAPSVSSRPSALPTSTPTATPTAHPTAFPTFTFRPTSIPTTATPSVVPTFSPTVTPSTHFPTAPLRTLLSMDLEVTLNNVNLDVLSTNSSAQLAFETAVAMSIPFMEASQVSYLYSQTAGSTISRHLRAVAITTLTNSVVGFNLLFYIEYFGYATANEASSSIQSLLSNAISSGSFATNLNTAAARYGTSAVFTASSASNLKVLRSSVQTAGGNDHNLYVDWPLYAKILLPIGVFIVVFICIGALVAYNQHYHVLELEFIGPTVSYNLRRFRGNKDKEISSPSAAAGVEAQFANLMLSEEYQTHSDTDPILITDNPVKSPPMNASSDAASTSNPALKSAKSILKKGGDSSGKKAKEAVAQSPPGTGISSEEAVSAEGISPGAIAMMPIVPKRQDFVSALFRRPTTTSKKDKPKQSKKLNNHTAEKSATDPPLGSGETIREGADGASGDVVVATEAMDTPETTQQPVDKESTLPSNDLDGQNSAANEGVAASSNDTHAPAEALPVAKRPGFFSFF